MKKAMYVLALLMVVLMPSMGQAQEPSDNGTIPPYTLWLPMVGMPSLEEMYPECPYETTLVSPEDGAERYWGGVTFEWETEAPQSHLRLVNHYTDSWTLNFTTSDNSYGVSKAPVPLTWKVRAMCDTSEGVFYGPWSTEWNLYGTD